jgi:hypothetical protein
MEVYSCDFGSLFGVMFALCLMSFVTSFTELCNVHANREAHKAWIQPVLIEAVGEVLQLLQTRQVKLAEPHASPDDLVSANLNTRQIATSV